jgi:polar amino acid transport system substrate-binding protein
MASAISSGTEGSTVRTAQKSLLGKAKERPDLVRQVMDTARREGLSATLRKVRARLDTLKGLGYSAAGEVISVGAGVESLAVGDRVACAGVGYACHAEINWVPRNLVARIPAGVSFEDGAFATLGAIALQGIHQAEIPFGGTVAVIGLGLIGQITTRLLRAGGFRVVGVDLDAEAVATARQAGIDLALRGTGSEIVDQVLAFSNQVGADAVIITASSNAGAVVDLAGEIVRDRGIVAIVGGVRIDIPRSVSSVFYDKEARIVFSRSYGPGRYDPDYEERGFDYPVGYVRWTEGRNMGLFLDFLARDRIDLEGIVTHAFDIADAEAAFRLLSAKNPEERSLGIVLRYSPAIDLAPAPERSAVRGSGSFSPGANGISAPPNGSESGTTTPTPSNTAFVAPKSPGSAVGIGLIGVGNFARGTLLPALRGAGAHHLAAVTTASGLSAYAACEQFRIARAHDSVESLLSDPSVDAVAILTRHDTHADLAAQALAAGKHVFVEKPLALNADELLRVVSARGEHGRLLMVGYNRRFSVAGAALRDTLSRLNGPFQIDYRINAGPMDRNHWYQDPLVGGGRIIGEGGHFVDLLIHALGALPVRVSAHALQDHSGRWLPSDNIAATLLFSDGSVATIRYVAAGDQRYPKERIEVLGDGAVVILDDLRQLEIHRGGKRETHRFRSGKGHREELQAFLQAVTTAPLRDPIPLEELRATSLATFAMMESVGQGGGAITL